MMICVAADRGDRIEVPHVVESSLTIRGSIVVDLINAKQRNEETNEHEKTQKWETTVDIYTKK